LALHDAQSGEFDVTAPTAQNHGPVRVHSTYHFAYADGAPFRPIGTTCYNLTHMVDSIEDETLASLASSPFNKIRFCVFPKHQAGNTNELALYPFEGTPPKTWDFTRFDPRFFQHLEKRVGDLRDRGVEADVILFDPYDKGRWGFDRMPADVDDRYVRYMVARLAAYRNVWWSLSNEYDFNKNKTEADWDRLFQVVEAADPYGHLRSIHNGFYIYNNTKPWVTHASIQNGSAVEDNGRAELYRDVYRKPVVYDEVKYEGNIARRWGKPVRRRNGVSLLGRHDCRDVCNARRNVVESGPYFVDVGRRQVARAESGAAGVPEAGVGGESAGGNRSHR
jgi:hypothetical protein